MKDNTFESNDRDTHGYFVLKNAFSIIKPIEKKIGKKVKIHYRADTDSY